MGVATLTPGGWEDPFLLKLDGTGQYLWARGLTINANNYGRVVGGMICIGLVGWSLDWSMRRLERLDEVRWGFSKIV